MENEERRNQRAGQNHDSKRNVTGVHRGISSHAAREETQSSFTAGMTETRLKCEEGRSPDLPSYGLLKTAPRLSF